MRNVPRLSFVLMAATTLSLSSCSSASVSSESEVISVVEAFYGAIKKGDAAAAMSVIASDAVFLESGKLETRAEYEMNHLPADIEFESEVTGINVNPRTHPMTKYTEPAMTVDEADSMRISSRTMSARAT